MITARYMLDTNIISDVVRNPMGRAADVMHGLNRDDICLSSIVLSEILFGIQRKGSERLTRLVEGVLERIAVIAYDDLAGRHYAEICTTLKNREHLSAQPTCSSPPTRCRWIWFWSPTIPANLPVYPG